jgi:hypothetical protein
LGRLLAEEDKMRTHAGVVLPLLVAVLSFDAMARSTKSAEEVTCGQEIAADSEVPEKLAQLMSHVAVNMEAHAKWVAGSVGGQLEHDRLMVVAREYESIAAAAGRAAVAMKDMRSVPPVQHDPSQLDRAGQVRWMRSKIHMQLEFARLLTRHAEVSKKVLADMEAK